MKLDSKKSKAAVKNSAVKQKKVKAKAANPAKAQIGRASCRERV